MHDISSPSRRTSFALPGPIGFGRPALRRAKARIRLMLGLDPLVEHWGWRGKPVSRLYLERFLEEHAASIRGRCLEFQEDSYTTKYGGSNVESVDVLNKEPERPGSTYVADLTKDNDLPSEHFDCIICTYVLHIVYEKERMVAEMHRMLKPGGTLLVAVPNITVHYQHFPELWRFTAPGLQVLLETAFGEGSVIATGYGNSLTAAGELRGLAVNDFTQAELDHQDPRYALVVCAKATKDGWASQG